MLSLNRKEEKMSSNKILRILCSLPVIFIFSYFIPFVGICLILLRMFFYKGRNSFSTPIVFIGVGIAIVIPKMVGYLFEVLNININKIPYLKDILSTDLYNNNLVQYGKYLIIVGFIFLVISFVMKIIARNLNVGINEFMVNYIKESIKQEERILKQNDMEMKIKQEKAKSTCYVKCPNCGADNLFSDKIGTCTYCRGKLVNKRYKD
jgi:hypothetical protein